MRRVHALLAVALVAPFIALAPVTADAHRRSASLGNANVIWEWNRIAVDTLTADSATTPPRKLPVEGYLYLAFVQAARHVGVAVSSIGTVVAGSAAPKFVDGQGREIALERLSYSHF